MQDISELERRIAAAFDRIDRGLERADRARATVVVPPPQMVEVESSKSATAQLGSVLQSLEIAQASNEDWAKRYATLEAQMADAAALAAGEIAKLNTDLATATADLEAALATPQDQPVQTAQELQVLDEQLAELRRQLATQSVELMQLRAQRSAEIEELKSIVAALTPLIEEAHSNA